MKQEAQRLMHNSSTTLSSVSKNNKIILHFSLFESDLKDFRGQSEWPAALGKLRERSGSGEWDDGAHGGRPAGAESWAASASLITCCSVTESVKTTSVAECESEFIV